MTASPDEPGGVSLGSFRWPALLAIAAWTAVAALVVAVNTWQEVHHTRELALLEARAIFDKDLGLRRWATRHGGVYVPVDERTPPNPYLAFLPERDITTASGRALTLMNPAYMLRQVMAERDDTLGVREHITSLQPLNPANAPDEWEARALAAFAGGLDEVSEVVVGEDGVAAVRLMRPLFADEGCLKCHAHQGYREGDVRGGIAVGVSLAPYQQQQRVKVVMFGLSASILWAIGAVGIGIGFVSAARGERERGRIQGEVARARDRLDATLDALPDLLLEVDRDGVIRSLRAPTATGLDRAAGDLVGQRVEEALAEAGELVSRAVAEAFATGRSQGTVAAVAGGGERRWLELSVSGPRGDREVATVLARDVSERVRFESSLRASEDKYRTLYDRAADGIALVDAETGVVVDCNATLAAMVGRPRGEIVGRRVEELHPGEDRVEGGCAAVFTERGGGVDPGPAEGRLLTAGGEPRWVEVKADRVEVDGRALLQGVYRDITARLEAERERASLEEQLRQAQRLEAVGQLAGGIAHDFNNILQVILGSSELLRDRFGASAAELDDIQAAARRARDLVRQLLAFSRHQALQLRPLDLNEVVGELLKMIDRVLGEHLVVELRLEPGLALVQGDRGQLEQAVMNLCLNARDAMSGGGRLTISTATYPDAGSVRLTVADTGTGIAAEHVPHIFEPFFTTKGVGRGTGLGLAVVYGIVVSHRGEITVASTPGGTAFTISLPAVDAAPERSQRPAESGGHHGGSETLLIAEDDPQVRKLVAGILTRAGYRVVTAADGEEAVALFSACGGDVALVVLDVVMPRLGGVAALAAMRAARPGLRAVLVSGYAPERELAGLDPDQAIGRLTKPVAAADLLAAVRAQLDREA